MKLVEHEGKELFARYGIAIPKGVVVTKADELPDWEQAVLKAQVHSGDRFAHGGIRICNSIEESHTAVTQLFDSIIQGEKVTTILVEEKIPAKKEYYASLSYSGEYRGPVLSLSITGGSGIAQAQITPISILTGMTPDIARAALASAHVPDDEHDALIDLLSLLWRIFIEECALIVEINPLFKTESGFVAGDAKVVIDDDKNSSNERRIVEMHGDIAILASGGGASMLNMDALMRAGGKPANYTEYSGNPPAEVVRDLTIKVLSHEGLHGCWVVGAFANFTDIYVTLSGFLEGLRAINPKPTYPIVIRRDGPRRAEAFAMLEAAKAEGLDFHLYDSTTSMEESAVIMAKLAHTS